MPVIELAPWTSSEDPAGFGGRDDRHGNMRIFHHVLTDATQHSSSEHAEATRSHDNGVGVHAISQIDYHWSGFS